MKRSVVAVWLLLMVVGFCWPTVVSVGLVHADGGEWAVIRGELPAGWVTMGPEELDFFARGGYAVLAQPGRLVAGYRSGEVQAPDDGPLILVFEVESEEKMAPEQVQKIYSWFESQRVLVIDALPNKVERMTMENIEYIPARSTIIFQSALEMEGREFVCLISIVFMRDGYVMLVGLAEWEDERQREEIAAFIHSVEVPEQRRLQLYQSRRSGFGTWLAVNWSRVLGGVLLVSVFAVALLRRRDN